MSPTPLWPASYPHSPGVIPPSTVPHIPGTSASAVWFITWQVDVPMMATICPGPIACAAGAVTCASTLPTATAMPSGRPVHADASAVRFPARPPSGASGCSSLSATKPANRSSSAARYASDGYAPSCRMPL